MWHDFYLAWRYLRHNKLRSSILIACLGIIGALPLALHSLLGEGERLMSARAEATPLLVGAKGSALDLTMNVLYFREASPPIKVAEADRILETGWADALPVYSRFRVQGLPLVAVTPDYFGFRQLAPARGEMLAMLGDCLLGADAADRLGLQPGDVLLTTPENLFDLAGIYPLKLHITGILNRTRTPDDQAVFVDLKTAWIIEGLGHGHSVNETRPSFQTGPFGETQNTLLADPSLITYTEITAENVDSFHFHGDPATYPVSGVIAVPRDRRASTLLRGRYLDHEQDVQIVQPAEPTRALLQNVFRVGALFDGILLVVGCATLLVVALVFALSMRLRQREFQTIQLLGCSRMTVLRLALAEVALIALASTALSLLILKLTQHYSPELVQRLVIS
jgi:putative ABC transport system permease protein